VGSPASRAEDRQANGPRPHHPSKSMNPSDHRPLHSYDLTMGIAPAPAPRRRSTLAEQDRKSRRRWAWSDHRSVLASPPLGSAFGFHSIQPAGAVVLQKGGHRVTIRVPGPGWPGTRRPPSPPFRPPSAQRRHSGRLSAGTRGARFHPDLRKEVRTPAQMGLGQPRIEAPRAA
jgi:hypothetical protein